jgi:hypothetical protein
MRRLFHNRFRLLAAMSVILLGALVQTRAGQVYCRSEFHRYFEGLGAADARVNPVERLIFSLLLAKTNPERQAPRLLDAPAKQL